MVTQIDPLGPDPIDRDPRPGPDPYRSPTAARRGEAVALAWAEHHQLRGPDRRKHRATNHEAQLIAKDGFCFVLYCARLRGIRLIQKD
jgi:hypothetical protein